MTDEQLVLLSIAIPDFYLINLFSIKSLKNTGYNFLKTRCRCTTVQNQTMFYLLLIMTKEKQETVTF